MGPKLEKWNSPVQCAKCGDKIHSRYSGEFVSCKCGAISVDQTPEYQRFIGNINDFVEVNESQPLL